MKHDMRPTERRQVSASLAFPSLPPGPRPPSALVHLTVRVDPDLRQRFRVALAERGETAQDVVADCLERWIAQQPR